MERGKYFMVRTIYLDYNKAVRNKLIVDREAYLEKYNVTTLGADGEYGINRSQPYRLLQGAPLIISIEGTYVCVNDLLELVTRPRYKATVNKFIQDCKSLCPNKEIIRWVWDRP